MDKTDEKNYSSSDELNRKNFSQEKRMFKREKCEKIIRYSNSIYLFGGRKLILEGKAIDISCGGLGMLTSVELEQNDVVLLINIDGHNAGVVKNCRMVSSDCYRVGVEFS